MLRISSISAEDAAQYAQRVREIARGTDALLLIEFSILINTKTIKGTGLYTLDSFMSSRVRNQDSIGAKQGSSVAMRSETMPVHKFRQ